MVNSEFLIIVLLLGLSNIHAMSIKRSSEQLQDNNLEKADETSYKVNYDVYPIVFPKRAAMLLDRLMVALHHALEDDDPKQLQKINEMYRHGQFPSLSNTPTKPNIQPKYYKDESEDMEGKSMELGLRTDYDNEYSQSDEAMDLQRRGHSAGLDGGNQGRVYWRCYFNAVTCF